MLLQVLPSLKSSSLKMSIIPFFHQRAYDGGMTTANRPGRQALAAAGGERLWGSTVGHDLSFALARANALSLAAAHGALAEHGLRVRQYSVLAIVVGDLRPSQRELSDYLRLDPSQIVAVVDHLQSRGLVRREPDPNDRRANVVVATEAGQELYGVARTAAQRAERDLLSVLDADEVAALGGALRKLAAAPDGA